MKYIDLKNKINSKYFSPTDIRNSGSNYSSATISRWASQGLIRKIRNGLYIFSDQEKTIDVKELASIVVEPSYISLESALSMAGLIPEAVFTTTCITTKLPISYATYLGNIEYRHVSPKLYFGYISVDSDTKPYYLAEPEKALLDYIYLTATIDNRDAVFELRLNPENFNNLDQNKLDQYLQVFHNSRMDHVITQIRKMYARN
jgi:predicted transcriptional regulator of viral defense system